VVGSTKVKFTILKDGAIQAVMVERSSGLIALDNAANRAVMRTQRLPPLPSPFPNPTLTVHMIFEYQR
jgi:TonB family protein